MVVFLRRQLIGGLSLLIAIAALFGTHFKFTPVVLALLSFGALWMLVVVVDAVRRRGSPDVHGQARDVLSAWIAHGFNLRIAGTTDTQVLQWASRLTDLVGAMFGDAERNAFMTHIPGFAGPANAAQREDWISRCNEALGELVRRSDSLDVLDTFDPAEWQV